MPTIDFPDTTNINITVGDRGKKYVEIPDVPTYDLYVNSIKTGTEDTLYFRMKNKGTLTRVFVKEDISFGNHTVVQVVYASPAGDSVITQDKFRGNLLFYTQEDFNIRNTDYSKLQGTYISKKKINLISNINFAGQLLANELEIGDNFSGKNFRFVIVLYCYRLIRWRSQERNVIQNLGSKSPEKCSNVGRRTSTRKHIVKNKEDCLCNTF